MHRNLYTYMRFCDVNKEYEYMSTEQSEFENIEHLGQRFELPSDTRYQV